MFQFKRITPESVPRALAKAERYRLLNEPEEAESICEDILVIDPRLKEPYYRVYYEGIICERRAKAQYSTQRPSPFVCSVLREAMQLYEKAAEISPPENDDAVLRWNACARFIKNNPDLRADVENLSPEVGFGDEVPPR